MHTETVVADFDDLDGYREGRSSVSGWARR